MNVVTSTLRFIGLVVVLWQITMWCKLGYMMVHDQPQCIRTGFPIITTITLC